MKTYNLKAYRLAYSDGRGNYSTLEVIAESAEQAAAYYTAEYGVTVVSCDETSWPTPEQPRGIVPIGWTAAETETTETAETAETAEATETTETAETAPAAETEATETERSKRIAGILDDIHGEIVTGYYRRKQRVTARYIRESERAGVPTVRVGYCEAQWLLSYLTPAYYTAGVYGWNCDVYTVAGLNICTGYRGMVGKPAVLTADYERRARAAAGEDERNAILAEWIAANLDAIQTAREGVRA